MRNDPYFMLIKPEGDTRRYCGRCELPAVVCACDDAEAYDAPQTPPENHNGQ